MNSGRPIHQERHQKQQEHFEHNQEINYADRACIYLKDGQCSVYERRPFICRLTHVSSEPESCHYENDKTPIEHLPVTRAALLVGAFYMANPDIELIPLLIS